MNRRQFFATSAQTALWMSALTGCRTLPAAMGAHPHGRPLPTPQQLRWQRDELGIFVHFGVNTFTDREWGDGQEDPRIFNPARLDARQWARAARGAGFRHMILTAKHHDGFCLWPTATTAHSVRSSPWRGGQGDVVREMTEACRAEGLGVGLYLSPWDQNAPQYGDSAAYNDFYVRQLTELLTGYGPLVEVWFDGAKGPDARHMEYDWPRFHRVIRELQPDALIFSDSGPDIRWIGNERGIAGDPNWATVDPALVPYPGIPGDHIIQALQHGQAHGSVWRPGEADVSIRPGWFWHPAQDDRVRTPDNLLDLYFLSVGRNAGLLLNVPPTTDGLFHATDVRHLQQFGERREALFATDLARGARAEASGTAGRAHAAGRVSDGDPDTFWSPPPGTTTGWVEIALPRPTTFSVVSIQEAIAHGQHVERYRVDAWSGGVWTAVSQGTTIGHRKLDRVAPVTAERLRLTIDAALDTPRIGSVALYHG
jgi:alpha-L-fucosidase